MTNREIEKTLERIVNAIEKIAPPIPAIPAIPAIPPLPTNSEDHNLLQKVALTSAILDTKVDQIQADVSELKKDKNVYVTQTEHQDLIKIIGDHELRLRRDEINITRILTWGTITVFLVGLLEAGLTIYFH